MTFLAFKTLQIFVCTGTITHKKITKLIPKQFRFGNSSAQVTEYNSNNNSVRDSEILCSHCLPRPSNSRNNLVRQSQSRNYRKEFENNKVRFGNHFVCGIFPICPGTLWGFSRLVLFLFLGLLSAPTRNSPERVRDTIWTIPEKSGKHPGLETPRSAFNPSLASSRHCAPPMQAFGTNKSARTCCHLVNSEAEICPLPSVSSILKTLIRSHSGTLALKTADL